MLVMVCKATIAIYWGRTENRKLEASPWHCSGHDALFLCNGQAQLCALAANVSSRHESNGKQASYSVSRVHDYSVSRVHFMAPNISSRHESNGKQASYSVSRVHDWKPRC